MHKNHRFRDEPRNGPFPFVSFSNSHSLFIAVHRIPFNGSGSNKEIFRLFSLVRSSQSTAERSNRLVDRNGCPIVHRGLTSLKRRSASLSIPSSFRTSDPYVEPPNDPSEKFRPLNQHQSQHLAWRPSGITSHGDTFSPAVLNASITSVPAIGSDASSVSHLRRSAQPSDRAAWRGGSAPRSRRELMSGQPLPVLDDAASDSSLLLNPQSQDHRRAFIQTEKERYHYDAHSLRDGHRPAISVFRPPRASTDVLGSNFHLGNQTGSFATLDSDCLGNPQLFSTQVPDRISYNRDNEQRPQRAVEGVLFTGAQLAALRHQT